MVWAGKQTHVSRGACRRKLSVEAIRIETGRRSTDFGQMSEDTLDFVRVLDEGDDLHVGTALRRHERVNLVRLRQESVPGAFARADVDLFVAF